MPDTPHKPIASTLGFILSPDRQSVLMVHRVFRRDDENLGLYNGIGGKLERGEDVAAGMIREIREETGLVATSLKLRGTLSWADFGPRKQDWLAFVFLVEDWTGEPAATNEEGTLHWVPVAELDALPMWAGDRLFLPLVFDGDPRLFHGYMRYEGDAPAEWRYTRL
ncbi:MAG: NUDIX hydrolase [Kiritimatiellia bacterium]|jgi:8-oxo-dGTP diphosphatase